jgi:hypothetical protein
MEAPVTPHLTLALVGLLFVLVFSALSYFRREGISMRFTVEAVVLTVAATVASAIGQFDLNPALFILLLYVITMRVRLLVDLGNSLARRRNHGAAERVYALAERLGTDETGRLLVMLNRAVLALQREQPGVAATTLRNVLAASGSGYLGFKSVAACHYNLAVAYQRQGLDAQAAIEFNNVLDVWPATEYARYARIALERRKAQDESNASTTGEG